MINDQTPAGPARFAAPLGATADGEQPGAAADLTPANITAARITPMGRRSSFLISKLLSVKAADRLSIGRSSDAADSSDGSCPNCENRRPMFIGLRVSKLEHYCG